MKIKIYHIDAFAGKIFSGNPAAVCPLNERLSDAIMQNIAGENNLAETAFYTREKNAYRIRWFTPTMEVDLCGHATLAAAHVLFHHEMVNKSMLTFFSRSGELRVQRELNLLTLDFPADRIEPVDLFPALTKSFNSIPDAVFKGKSDYMLVFKNENQILHLQPDLDSIAKLDARGVIVTAPGDTADFVSRFFAPQSGIDEDPVTGSAHTTLTPYWAKIFNKKELTAIQLSARRGFLQCKDCGDRVLIGGQARTYMIGEIEI